METINEINKIIIQNESSTTYGTLDKLLGCLHTFIIFFAFTGNTISFIIFRFEKKLKEISSFLILSFVVIIDNFAVLTWNLDHFLIPNFGFSIEYLSVYNCKFFRFIQFFSYQCSGLLLSLVITDRFITISCTPGSWASKLPFCSLKYALIWSISIILIIAILNLHILLLSGFPNQNINKNITDSFNKTYNLIIIPKRRFSCNHLSNGFHYYPIWNILNMILYSAIPSTVMTIFTTLLVFKTYKSQESSNSNSIAAKTYKKKRKITISLLAISTAFLVMTLPSTIFFAFIYFHIPEIPYGRYFDNFVDSLSFANHASIFFTSFISNSTFRRVVLQFINAHLFKKIEKKIEKKKEIYQETYA